MLALTFLGTSAARPTVERNVSSLALQRDGDTLLFDCGEGTQRQMMRYGVSFALSDIFFSHFHGDHYLGIIGLARTLGLQGREEPLRLYGPKGAKRVLEAALNLGVERVPFPLEIRELRAGDVIGERGPGSRGRSAGLRTDPNGSPHPAPYEIRVFATEHGGGSIGYALVESQRFGRFDPEKARAIGIPEGPLWGRLQRGESVVLADGREVPADSCVGPPRPGRKVVITGDTRGCASVVDAALGADLLVHEATFGEEEKDRAKETFHATAREAAQIAFAAGVKQLVLNHFSARYSTSAEELVKEAKSVFGNVSAARDGMTVEVGFTD